jgi:ClpP class serine protease
MIDPWWGLNLFSNFMNEVEAIRSGLSAKEVLRKYDMDAGQPTFMGLDGRPTSDQAGIAQIYLSGLMTTDGGMCSRGIKNMVDDLASIDANPEVKGLLLEINSGGGEATSAHMLYNALESFSKPVVTFGHFVGSAAYFAAAATDEIVGAGNGSQFGSIGVVFSISNEAIKQMKEDVTSFYSTLSADKNKPLRSLLAGDQGPLIEMLDDLAKNFQSEVKSNRTITNQEALKGGMFQAKSAKKSGLIDNIGTKAKAIKILNRHIKIKG